MGEKPILFSGPMVRAILDGRKTVTRRVLKPQPEKTPSGTWHVPWQVGGGSIMGPDATDRCIAIEMEQGLRTEVGDRLWVREAWRTLQKFDDLSPRHLADDRSKVTYEADPERKNTLWAFGRLRASMHMPRWASRLTLEVTGVKVERLQEISEEDALAEGVCQFVEDGDKVGWGNLAADDRAAIVRSTYGSARQAFRHLWETINGEEAWDTNPWVVAVSFERVTP